VLQNSKHQFVIETVEGVYRVLTLFQNRLTRNCCILVVHVLEFGQSAAVICVGIHWTDQRTISVQGFL